MCFFVIISSSSNGIRILPDGNNTGDVPSYVILNRHIRLHWKISIHQVAVVKCVVVGLLGVLQNCILPRASMGRSTITKDTKGGLHQLGSAQLGSSAALHSQMFGIFGSSAAYKIVNLLAAAWHIAARLSAARHFGSSTAWQLIGRSTARQLGSPAAS